MYWRVLCARPGSCASRRTGKLERSALAGREAWPRAFARSDDRDENSYSNREGSVCFAYDHFHPQCIFFGAAVKAKVIESLVSRMSRGRAPSVHQQLSTNVSCKLRPGSYLSSRFGEDAF